MTHDPMKDAVLLRSWAELLPDEAFKLKSFMNEVACRLETGAYQPRGRWETVPPRTCIKPTHEAANAFWEYWRENGETHKHGYYESTWGAINAALAVDHKRA